MNILFVNDIPFNPIGGGLERVTDVLTKEMVKRGYTIYYLYGKLPESKLYLLDYAFPATLYQLPCVGMFDNEENLAFYEQLQSDLKIDIVVNQRGLGGCYNSILPRTHTKLISVIHSTPEGAMRVYLSKIIECSAPPFRKLKRLLKGLLFPFVSAYWESRCIEERKAAYNQLAKYSDVIVTLSAKYNSIMNKYLDVPQKATLVSIPNPNTFRVSGSFNEFKGKNILYVGRLEKVDKNPIRILKIWKDLHCKYPAWQLKIVGEGTEKVKMQEYVKLHSLNNVHFEGQQSDVSQYYREASFVCLTSNFEGWGMALTEGMQFGCIPFTFNNYGAAYEIIDDGINGCLISAYNLKEYGSRLSELMSDDDMRSKMSMAAIEKVKMFSVENVVDKWEEIFNSLYVKFD